MENSDKTREELLAELASARKIISELEAMKRVLRASGERYKQIVDKANSIILLMDTKGNITFLNQFADKFFGYYEGQLIGKSVIGTIVSEKDSAGKNLADMIKDIVGHPDRHSVNENENIRRNGERASI